MARRRTWERRNRGMTDLSAKPLALIKGAGDLATGVALRLHHVGFRLVMTEIEEPTVVRRTVALAEAVYEGESVVEGMKAVLARGADEAREILEDGNIAVLIDPRADIKGQLQPNLLVDAVMAKRNLGTTIDDARVVVALGPGFAAGDTVAFVDETPVKSEIDGILRGLLRSGIRVTEGFKVGDVDPRAQFQHCHTVSDKALSVGGGVLEAAGHLLGVFRVRG